MSMEDLERILTLEKRLYSIAVDSLEQAKYIDRKSRMKDLERFSQDVAMAGITPYYRSALMERCEGYKKKLSEYSKSEDSGKGHALLSFALGVLSVIAGIKLRDMYNECRKGRLEQLACEIYERLRENDTKI